MSHIPRMQLNDENETFSFDEGYTTKGRETTKQCINTILSNEICKNEI